MSAYNLNRKGSIGTGIGLNDVASGSFTLLNNIIAYWKLDDASGDAIDSVSTYDGTVVGATYSATGKIGTAYTFDGVNDYVNINSVLTPLASTTQGTWAAWMKPVDATPTSDEILLSFADKNAIEFLQLSVGTTGKLGVNCIVATVAKWKKETTTSAFSDNTWTHIALVQDGVSPILYVDGVAVAQSFVGSGTEYGVWFSSFTGIDACRIGNRNVNNSGEANFFNGEIDEVGIWDRALTSAEITILYNSNVGKTHPFSAADANALNDGLVSYYKLDDASGDAIDEVNQLDGTVVGATYSATGKIGDAYTFDGVNDYVGIGTILTPLASTTQGTWAAWIKPVDSTPISNEVLISFGDVNANEFINVNIQTSGVLRAACNLSGVGQWQLNTDSTAFMSGVWTHIAMSHNATQPTLYVDGIAVAQTFAVSTDKTSWFYDLTGVDNGKIGSLDYNSLGNGFFFNGEIDEVGIWSRALTADEITEIYNSNVGKIHPFT